ncbi:MAG: GNAT family N-acetyltransferase [Eubacteriales bacterium]|jgi:ribosomal protein S18 acetylase RimI-like enzyme
MYLYKSLKDISNAQIADCLNLAFSDYALPFQLTEEQLGTHLATSGADKALSYGAFWEDKMVGFILNSCNMYNDEKAVFDVGTGVIPQHRGNKVFTELFGFAQQELLKYGAKKYYLEVLQQNDKAIQAYQKQGFTICREFYVLKASIENQKAMDCTVEYIGLEEFDFRKINHCHCARPSFEHSTNILKMNLHYYAVAYRQRNQKITAFCIFSKETGHVIQLGYTDICELKIIVQWLASKFENIIIKNIDKKDGEILQMLYSMGAIDIARQFEMVKDLRSDL